MLPDFLVAGAPKCGTTAIWAWLREHPEICLAINKEPRFFTRYKAPPISDTSHSDHLRSGTYGRSFGWYASLFQSTANEKRLFGEASTVYFSAPDAPELIQAANPHVRLIFVLRDPIQRAYSHYWQEVRYGLKLPSFQEMVRIRHPRLQYYLNVSHYAEHLKRYEEVFGRDRMLVLVDGDLKTNALEVMRRVCAHLGIDRSFIPSSIDKQFNPQHAPHSDWLARLLSRTPEAVEHLPNGIRQRLGRVRRRIARLNLRPTECPPLPPAVRAQLIPEFRADSACAEAYIGRSLRSWSTVSPSSEEPARSI